MNKNLYSLGLMSGTSMDGIDASIIKSDGEQSIEIIDNIYLKYDFSLRSNLKKIIDSCTSKDQFKKLSESIRKIENEVTLCHAEACKTITKKNKNIDMDLIGFHGQTVLHKPNQGYSIQIGDPKLLSRLTNKTVVANFRDNDILNGGQGAPLTPLYHQLILSKIKINYPSVMINIGGISNITYLEKKNKIISFDTGPGNYLIDQWVKSNSKMEFDDMGSLAKSGKLNNDILEKFLSNDYYRAKNPKSLDVKDFNLNDLRGMSLEDGCATLSMLTVKSICNSINNLREIPNIILFSGGGRKNQFIIDNIKKILNKQIHLIDEFNFNGDFTESQAFAYLAIRSYLKKYISLPETTGVKNPCLGGKIYRN